MDPDQPRSNYRGKKKAHGSTFDQSGDPSQGQKPNQGQGGGGKYKQKQLLKQQQQELQQHAAEGSTSGGSVPPAEPPQDQIPQQGQGGGGKYKQKQLKKQQQQGLEQEAASGTQISLPTVSDPATPSPSSQDRKEPASSARGVLIRPNAHGTAGTAVKLEANYLALDLQKLPSEVYHYDVDIQPATSRKWLRACFKRFCVENLAGELPFDGKKNAYAVRKQGNFEKVDVVVALDNRERRFTVSLKLAAAVDLRCLKGKTEPKDLVRFAVAKQFLETVFGTAADREPFKKFNRSVYLPPRQRIDVGANHELWYGLHQSVIIGSKLFLNLDVAHKAFPSGVPVLKVVGDLARRKWNDPSLVPYRMDAALATKLHNFLKGLELSYTGPNAVAKVFKYNSLREPASRQFFKRDDGTQMTVAAYFEQLGCQLKYPDLPVMHVGSTVRNIMLPLELCQIMPGQAINKKHPDECTAQIIKLAATDTVTRKRKIMDFKNQINYNVNPIIREFGIGVAKDFEVIDGRITDPPDVVYKNRKIVPNNGQWNAELFVRVNQRELRWVILNLDNYTRQNEIDIFGKNIYIESRKKGMQLQPFSMQNNYCEPGTMPRNTKQLEMELANLLNVFKKQKIDIAVVVIPDVGEHYSRVKQKAELDVGVLTSCIKGQKSITKARSPITVVNNFLLKINTKTNGTNHVVPNTMYPFIRKRVMFVGADVTHPSPEQTSIPSVVGVAASYDQDGIHYKMCFRLQDPKEEMILDLEAIMKHMLTYYKKSNNQLPETIMYYRDGVSDGQFDQVLAIELNAIQRAAAAMNPANKFNVTFVVVQKRHHTRFFPGPGCPAEGRNQNVPPGTVVDRYITAPNHFQFFMISHQAPQGVAKPCKYTVLYDDERWDVDKLEAITYALCHTYARCTKAVSYPTPTYYAHWIAARGKVYIQGQHLNMDNLDQENKRLQVRPEIINGYPMFFV